MKVFNHSGYKVTISKHDGGYLYHADNGKHQVADPHPHYHDGLYPTAKEAEKSCKQAILVFEVMAMFSELSGREQAHVALVIKHVHDGKLVL